MARRREPQQPQQPWGEQHASHVPDEFEQAGRRGWYRGRGEHENDDARYGHEPRWPGPVGEELGPHPVPERARGDHDRPSGPQGYARTREVPQGDDFDGTASRAGTSGYDDYETESLYGEAFQDGDWPQAWREASGDRPAASRGSHRGLGPQGYRRSDQRILDEVHERLTDDPYVDARGLQVSVEQGIVHIEGDVAERWVKHHVEHVVARCAGVVDVDNRVRVQRGAD